MTTVKRLIKTSSSSSAETEKSSQNAAATAMTPQTNVSETNKKAANPFPTTPYQKFLIQHLHKKTEGSDTITNTRISGGSYSIPEEKYGEFLKLYHDHVFVQNNHEFLTERQFKDSGPIAIDFDFQFSKDTQERKYTQTHIINILNAYLEELAGIYQLIDPSGQDDDDEDDPNALKSVFDIFVFEKPTINRMFAESKGIVKDGLHFLINLNADSLTKEILRDRILRKLPNILCGDETSIGLTNTLESVVDAGVAKGSTAWTLYGSKKPSHDAYELTSWYEVGISKQEAKFVLSTPHTHLALPENLERLSVRNRNHPELWFREVFASLRMETIQKKEEANLRPEFSDPFLTNTPQTHIQNPGLKGLGLITGNKGLISVGIPESSILAITSMEQLEALTFGFLDNLRLIQTPEAYELIETYEYVMCLPPSYYETGSHNNRIKVCWALHNISPALLIVWIRFFFQRSSKDFRRIPELVEEWNKTDLRRSIPLTKGSIRHWAKQENLTDYEKTRKNTIDFHIDQTIKKLTLNSLDANEDADKRTGDDDYGKAYVLYQMFKDDFVCISPKHQIWYQFYDHYWHEVEGGTPLRLAISQQLRDMYIQKAKKFKDQLAKIDPDHPDYKMKKKLAQMVLEMANKMGQTSHKKHIMAEASDLFWDSGFVEKLDTQPYLLCCKNGVMDFREKRFRRGYPEDYLSKCTNVCYTPLYQGLKPTKQGEANQHIMEEIREFMHQLFPEEPLYEYMWEHLASILIGDIVLTQGLHIYLGKGRNGKSTLVDGLLGAILGTYKVVLPVSFYTTERSKQGSASPEIVKLLGARLACSPEPSKGEHLIEGPMKQLTSGIDLMSGRALYKDLIEFRPQCHPVICANNLPSVQATDEGTWRRIKIVNFLSYFTEKPEHGNPFKPYQFELVPNFDKKIEEWKETFLAMLIEKAVETGGKVRSCELVERASNEYRAKQDVISEFITELVMPDIRAKITKSEIQQHFTTWYRGAYGATSIPPIMDVHEALDRHFGNYNRAQKGWLGVRINEKATATTGFEKVVDLLSEGDDNKSTVSEMTADTEAMNSPANRLDVPSEPAVVVKKKLIKKKM